MHPTRRRTAAGLGLAAAAATLPACTLLSRPSPLTMDTLLDTAACATGPAPVLLVWLPGANMTLDELQREGFVAAVRARGLAVDVLLVDSSLRWTYEGTVMQRLRDEVIGPARAQGRQRIWVAGISLGGFLALGYAMDHPGELEGVLALAPYLGRRALLQAIEAAGGPLAWRRDTPPPAADDHEQRLWRWLSAPPPDAPALWLGYGTEDRFAPAHRLWAGLLPAARVGTAPGGHDWPPWRALWAAWLDRAPLPRQCA
jgi:pimeloyl-ACP methyl ester carboxylesterase